MDKVSKIISVVIFLLLVSYAGYTFYLTNTINLEIKEACVANICIPGVPIQLKLTLNDNKTNTRNVTIQSSFIEGKEYTTEIETNKEITISVPSTTDISTPKKVYIEVRPDMDTTVFNAVYKAIFGSKQYPVNVRYPEITIQTSPKINEACVEKEGIYFDRILIDSKEEIQYQCKIQIATAGLVNISHTELKEIGISQGDFKTAYVTSYYNVQQNSNSTGIEDIEVKPTNCQVGDVDILVYTVCNITGREIVIKYNDPLDITCNLRQVECQT